MSNAGRILSVNPNLSIPGGEIIIECAEVEIKDPAKVVVYFDEHEARIVGASNERFVVIVPEDLDTQIAKVLIENDENRSEPFEIKIGKKLSDNLHLVSNPAIDPTDNSIILTRSGSRGQQLPVTLFRLEIDGFLTEMAVEMMNPTGIAFDKKDKLFVTNRAEGEVYQINNGNELVPIASDLGVATGIAFDQEGTMYIGDRSGTIFKINEFGDKESWAMLEPSVSAYHLAFDANDQLYVTAPGLCSYDSVFRVGPDGLEEVFFKGLGRPQGLAFDKKGNLYVAACLKGRHGIIRISPNGDEAEMFVAGMSIVGLCFSRKGEMLIATNEAVYSLAVDVYGILLD